MSSPTAAGLAGGESLSSPTAIGTLGIAPGGAPSPPPSSARTVSQTLIALQRLYMGDLPLPPGVRLVGGNVYGKSRAMKLIDADEVQSCACRTRSAAGEAICGADDAACDNASTHSECLIGFCSRARCGNMRLQRGQWWPGLRVEEAGARGLGIVVRGDAAVKKGAFLLEYFGEVLTAVEKETRMAAYAAAARHFYVMSVGDGTFVDAAAYRSVAAFINHSCEPNVHVALWRVGAESRVMLSAARDLPLGEELVFDYGWGPADSLTVCACGARLCRALMNVGPDKVTATDAMPLGAWRAGGALDVVPGGGAALVGAWVRVWWDGDSGVRSEDACVAALDAERGLEARIVRALARKAGATIISPRAAGNDVHNVHNDKDDNDMEASPTARAAATDMRMRRLQGLDPAGRGCWHTARVIRWNAVLGRHTCKYASDAEEHDEDLLGWARSATANSPDAAAAFYAKAAAAGSGRGDAPPADTSSPWLRLEPAGTRVALNALIARLKGLGAASSRPLVRALPLVPTCPVFPLCDHFATELEVVPFIFPDDPRVAQSAIEAAFGKDVEVAPEGAMAEVSGSKTATFDDGEMSTFVAPPKRVVPAVVPVVASLETLPSGGFIEGEYDFGSFAMAPPPAPTVSVNVVAVANAVHQNGGGGDALEAARAQRAYVTAASAASAAAAAAIASDAARLGAADAYTASLALAFRESAAAVRAEAAAHRAERDTRAAAASVAGAAAEAAAARTVRRKRRAAKEARRADKVAAKALRRAAVKRARKEATNPASSTSSAKRAKGAEKSKSSNFAPPPQIVDAFALPLRSYLVTPAATYPFVGASLLSALRGGGSLCALSAGLAVCTGGGGGGALASGGDALRAAAAAAAADVLADALALDACPPPNDAEGCAAALASLAALGGSLGLGGGKFEDKFGDKFGDKLFWRRLVIAGAVSLASSTAAADRDVSSAPRAIGTAAAYMAAASLLPWEGHIEAHIDKAAAELVLPMGELRVSADGSVLTGRLAAILRGAGAGAVAAAAAEVAFATAALAAAAAVTPIVSERAAKLCGGGERGGGGGGAVSTPSLTAVATRASGLALLGSMGGGALMRVGASAAQAATKAASSGAGAGADSVIPARLRRALLFVRPEKQSALAATLRLHAGRWAEAEGALHTARKAARASKKEADDTAMAVRGKGLATPASAVDEDGSGGGKSKSNSNSNSNLNEEQHSLVDDSWFGAAASAASVFPTFHAPLISLPRYPHFALPAHIFAAPDSDSPAAEKETIVCAYEYAPHSLAALVHADAHGALRGASAAARARLAYGMLRAASRALERDVALPGLCAETVLVSADGIARVDAAAAGAQRPSPMSVKASAKIERAWAATAPFVAKDVSRAAAAALAADASPHAVLDAPPGAEAAPGWPLRLAAVPLEVLLGLPAEAAPAGAALAWSAGFVAASALFGHTPWVPQVGLAAAAARAPATGALPPPPRRLARPRDPRARRHRRHGGSRGPRGLRRAALQAVAALRVGRVGARGASQVGAAFARRWERRRRRCRCCNRHARAPRSHHRGGRAAARRTGSRCGAVRA